MPNGIDLDRQTAKKEKPVGNILFTWLYDHSPGSRGKRSVLRAWRNHPRKWKSRSSGQSSSCMQRWIRGRRKLWGTVGLATLLLYHNLQAGIVDGHDSVLVVIRYRQRSTAFISAYEISPSASFEQDKHFYTLHKSARSRTNENIFVTFAAD